MKTEIKRKEKPAQLRFIVQMKKKSKSSNPSIQSKSTNIKGGPNIEANPPKILDHLAFLNYFVPHPNYILQQVQKICRVSLEINKMNYAT